MGKQHIIELNGKRYDAITGKIINDGPPANTATHKPVQAINRVGMDGFTIPSHKTQKSKTLMRGTVRKPTPHSDKTKSSTIAKSTGHVQASSIVSPHKLANAVKIPKSALVRRFSDGVISRVPQHKSAGGVTHKSSRIQAVATAVTATLDPVAHGLASAISHEQTQAKSIKRHVRLAKKLHIRPRVLSGSAMVLAFLFMAGFFAYQNVPNLNMRLASARSGVQGSLPSFQPAGFSMNSSVSYKPGQIIVGYKSNSDDRNFKITQNSSAWNSETLVANFFGGPNCGARCQVVEDRGKTIYLYDGSNATWVDGGIWYLVEGDSKLNSDQLLNIAASM